MGLTYEDVTFAVRHNIGRGLIIQHGLADIEIRVPFWHLVLMHRLAILLLTVKEARFRIIVTPMTLWQTLTIWQVDHQCGEDQDR